MAEEKFANIAFVTVTETAANTLTFKKLETGIAPFEKVAFLINRIEYFYQRTVAIFAATGDSLVIGLSASDQFSTAELDNSAIIDYHTQVRVDLGAAGSGFFDRQPFIKDFSTLPGGGLLVAPNPIYLFGVGSSLGAATTTWVRFFYTIKHLKSEDFWELVEMRRMIGT